MHQHVGAIERRGEKRLVGVAVQRRRHGARAISDVAIRRHDGVPLDAKRCQHGRLPVITYTRLTARRTFVAARIGGADRVPCVLGGAAAARLVSFPLGGRQVRVELSRNAPLNIMWT
jgi:hypothetical protein